VKYKLLAGLLCAAACYGQRQWEFGATLGYGWNRSAQVTASADEAKAGIGNRLVAGAVVGEDLYEHFSGEVRYLYQDGGPYLSNGGRKAQMQGHSHTLTYDLLIHVKDQNSRLRPYVAVGAGGRFYRATGPEPVTQPLPQFASLIGGSEWKFVTSLGAGVKYLVRDHLLVRADFRDYISPFPRSVFVPASGAANHGLFHQFTPMIGVSYWF
jgi:hypothetical protein